jgi:hypothetical protein
MTKEKLFVLIGHGAMTPCSNASPNGRFTRGLQATKKPSGNELPISMGPLKRYGPSLIASLPDISCDTAIRRMKSMNAVRDSPI